MFAIALELSSSWSSLIVTKQMAFKGTSAISLTLLGVHRLPVSPDKKSGCQIILSVDGYQFAGTALAMKQCASDGVISCDLLNRQLTGAGEQNARRYINVVDAWGAGCRAYHDEDLRQNHWGAAVDGTPGSGSGEKSLVCIAIGRTSTKTPEAGSGSSRALQGA
jgi:hypothetical protein